MLKKQLKNGSTVPLQTVRDHSKDTCHMTKNWTRTVIDLRHLQTCNWLDLHIQWECLRHQHEMNKNAALRPHKIALAYWIYDTDRARRFNSVNHYLPGVCDEQRASLLLPFNNEAWLYAVEMWTSRITVFPVHDVKFGVWCAVSATRILSPPPLFSRP